MKLKNGESNDDFEAEADNSGGREVEDPVSQEERLNGFLDLNPAIFSDPISLNSAECESHSRPVTPSEINPNPTPPDRPPSPPVESDHHDTNNSRLKEDDEEDDIIKGIQVNPETLDVPAAATSDLLERAFLAAQVDTDVGPEQTNHLYEFDVLGFGNAGLPPVSYDDPSRMATLAMPPFDETYTGNGSPPQTLTSPSSASSLMLSSASSPELTPSDCKRCIIPIQDSRLSHDPSLHQNHPMFPLLALMLEKCETATNNLDIVDEIEGSLYTEVKIFLEQLSLDQPLMTENPEVDELMMLGLQVLRIHVSELCKVKELCRDFSRRYITSVKMQSENLLKKDHGPLGWGEEDHAETISGLATNKVLFLPTFLG